ncbi:MAG: zf-HC2 domain-containing protein [Deltaproteobacteria bacterium]|nr:zf-HC2 domain-containing protein [Deltaproteobacteria bacterium]
MACLSHEELAAAFDGTLSRARSDRIRDHLSHCPRCAEEFKRLGEILASVETAPDPPAGLSQRAAALATRPPQASEKHAPAVAKPLQSSKRPRTS